MHIIRRQRDADIYRLLSGGRPIGSESGWGSFAGVVNDHRVSGRRYGACAGADREDGQREEDE